MLNHLWVRTITLAAAAVAIAVLPVLLGAQSASIRPTFEVASIKVNKSGEPRMQGIGFKPGGGFTATNVTLKELMQLAYARQPLERPQILGGPTWVDSERFDVIAKAASASTDPPAFLNAMKMMVQAMLEDRFQLVVHTEQKEVPIYSLALFRADGSLGPKLTKSDIDCTALMGERLKTGKFPELPQRPDLPPPCVFQPGLGRISGGASTIALFAQVLAPVVDRPVIDRTGLTGAYDLVVEYSPDELAGDSPKGASIFTALQEQLGLKLVPGRGQLDVTVIDHAEPPTEN
jgi:uncharacterized protein (TIGR03435 family)